MARIQPADSPRNAENGDEAGYDFRGEYSRIAQLGIATLPRTSSSIQIPLTESCLFALLQIPHYEA
jgi:hypothetical protein